VRCHGLPWPAWRNAPPAIRRRCWRRRRTTNKARRGCGAHALAVASPAWAREMGSTSGRAGSMPVRRFAAPARPYAGDIALPAADHRRRLAARSRSRRWRCARAGPSPSAWAAWQQKALREAKLFSDWAAKSTRAMRAPRARFTLAPDRRGGTARSVAGGSQPWCAASRRPER